MKHKKHTWLDIQVKSELWFKLKPKWNYFNNKKQIPRKQKYKADLVEVVNEIQD